MRAVAPVISFILALALWQGAVKLFHVPSYLVPGPLAIGQAFVADYAGLLRALLSTLSVTAAALLVACLVGVAMACAMAASVWARAALSVCCPGLARLGILRMVRDVLTMNGWLQTNAQGRIIQITLNRSDCMARWLVTALQDLLRQQNVDVNLGET